MRYSTIGALVEGTRTSARFWPTSPYYQAWLGGYLLHGPPSYGLTVAGDLDIETILQVLWSISPPGCRAMAAPEPHVALKPGSFQVIEATSHQEHPAWLVKSVIDSCSDIGAANRSSEAYVRYRTYELMFARFAHLHLPPLCTLPPIWPLASYHELELDCLGLIVQVGSHDHWALLFCFAARWAGCENLSTLHAPALETLHQVRIAPVNRSLRAQRSNLILVQQIRLLRSDHTQIRNIYLH